MLRVMVLCASLLLLGALSACGSRGGVTVDDAWVRAASAGMTAPIADANMDAIPTDTSASSMADHMMLGGNNSAAYLTISNTSDTPDRLVRAASDVAGEVQLHTSEMDNNVMRMREVPAIELPAHGQAELAPGGYHVMLMNLTRDLTAGETITITLTFERAGAMEVQATVRAP